MCAWCASKDMKDISEGGRPRCYWIGSYKCPASETVDLTKKVVGENMGDEWDVFLRQNQNITFLLRRYHSGESAFVYIGYELLPHNVHVTTRMFCPRWRKWDRTNFCSGLRLGDTVETEVRINLGSCPLNRDGYNREFNILIRNESHEEKMRVNIHMLCECPCERPEIAERHSQKCSGRGTYHCGLCSCPKNWYGKKCECHGSPIENADYWKECIPRFDYRACCGRGRCRCDGICECFNRTTVIGSFCEIEPVRSKDGQICGGRQYSICGDCLCKEKGEWQPCD